MIRDLMITFLIKALFEIGYGMVAQNVYVYYVYSPNIVKSFLSWIIVLSIVCLLRKEKWDNDSLYYYFKLFFYINIIPCCSLFWMQDARNAVFLIIMVYWGVFIATLFYLPKCIPKRWMISKDIIYDNYGALTVDSKFFYLFFVLTILIGAYCSWRYGEWRIFVSYNNIYHIRENAEAMSWGLGYIFAWCTNTLMPIALCEAISRRKIGCVLIELILFLLTYSIYGQKIILISALIVFIVTIFYEYLKNELDLFIGTGVIILQAVSVFFLLHDNIEFFQLSLQLFNRGLIVPNAHYFYYVDFFSKDENPFLFFSESLFRYFINSPYRESISRIIGSSPPYYPVGIDNNATSGLVSSAYANLGIVGVIIQPILIVLCLAFHSILVRRINNSLWLVFLILNSILLISIPFSTWLVTGGGLLQMLIFGLVAYIRKPKTQ